MSKVVAIEFDVRDWENGFWVTFRVPFRPETWDAIMTIPGSANIKQIKE